MSKLDVTVEVSKESYELAQGVVKFVGALKLALADGFQLGADLPEIVSAAFADLVPAVNGIGDMPAEYKEDPQAFLTAFMLAGGELYKVFQPK